MIETIEAASILGDLFSHVTGASRLYGFYCDEKKDNNKKELEEFEKEKEKKD